MPAAKKSKKAPRCQARENGRRCYRNGSGTPPLCRAHRIALSQNLDPDDPLQQLVDQADRWFKSREGRDVVVAAAGTMFDRLLDRIAIPRPHAAFPPPRPRATPPPPPPPPPPQKDPETLAREILHFGPKEPLTRQKIKERQRLLAAAVHPDKGGDVAAMQRINQAADILCNTL